MTRPSDRDHRQRQRQGRPPHERDRQEQSRQAPTERPPQSRARLERHRDDLPEWWTGTDARWDTDRRLRPGYRQAPRSTEPARPERESRSDTTRRKRADNERGGDREPRRRDAERDPSPRRERDERSDGRRASSRSRPREGFPDDPPSPSRGQSRERRSERYDTGTGERDWIGEPLPRPRRRASSPPDNRPLDNRQREKRQPNERNRREDRPSGRFATSSSSRRPDPDGPFVANPNRRAVDHRRTGPPEADGSRVETAPRGAGGRMLAVIGVLFLGFTVVFASAGGIFGRGDDDERPPTNRQVAGGNNQLAADTNTTSDTLSAQLEDGTQDQPEPNAPEGGNTAFAPTPTVDTGLQPRQSGYPGPWLDGVPTVCIDPGHGGRDRGRVRAADDRFPEIHEADIVLQQSLDLQKRLEAQGIVVVMTRTTDTEVNPNNEDINGDGRTAEDSGRDWILDEFQARINICNRAAADLLVSVHANGYDVQTPTSHGYEVWYTGARDFADQSFRLAVLAHEALGANMAAMGYNAQARGVKDDALVSVDASDPHLEAHMIMTGPKISGKITPSAMPGVILECLFITNDDDLAFMLSGYGHNAIVTAYEEAILQYFDEYEY